MKKLSILMVAAVLLSCSDVDDKNLKNQRDSLIFEVDALRVENDSLINAQRNFELQNDMPKIEIEKALRAKPELIPMEPVLGGKMKFENIKVIDNGLLFAEYSDGHVQGSSIFKAKRNGESLSFEVLYQIKNN